MVGAQALARQMTEEQSTFRGIALTLVSAILFSTTNAAAKWLMGDIPTGELLWVRSIVAFSLVSLFIRRGDWIALWSGRQLHLHLLRLVTSAIEVVCFYWAISRTPLADMTAIYLASPIYVTAMAAIFLHEPVGWRRWSAVVVGFAGVLVAVRPSGETVSVPMLVAVGGSILYATSLVVTRRLRATPSAMLVATQMAGLFVLSSATSALGWVMPSVGQLSLMGAIGLVSMIAFWCVNEGLRLARASAVAPFNYTSIVWAMSLGFFVFGDIPPVTTMVGAAIIVTAGLFIMLRERKLSETNSV
jgi:drug/metabolite transporter (DMT)-like permease